MILLNLRNFTKYWTSSINNTCWQLCENYNYITKFALKWDLISFSGEARRNEWEPPPQPETGKIFRGRIRVSKIHQSRISIGYTLQSFIPSLWQQQNLEIIPEFLKNFIGTKRKFTLSYWGWMRLLFHINSHSDFSVNILAFLLHTEVCAPLYSA